MQHTNQCIMTKIQIPHKKIKNIKKFFFFFNFLFVFSPDL